MPVSCANRINIRRNSDGVGAVHCVHQHPTGNKVHQPPVRFTAFTCALRVMNRINAHGESHHQFCQVSFINL